jgi:hypothetical protein
MFSFPRQRFKAIVGERLDGGEITMRDPVRALEAADVVIHVTQAEVNDSAAEG